MALQRALINDAGVIRQTPDTDQIPGMWAFPALAQNIALQEMLHRRWWGQDAFTPVNSAKNFVHVTGFQTETGGIDVSESVYAFDAVKKAVGCAGSAATQDRLPTGDVSHDAGVNPYSYTNVDDPIGSPDDSATKVIWNTYPPPGGGEHVRYSFSAFTVPAGATITKLRVTWRAYNYWPTDNVSNVEGSIKVNGTDYDASTPWPNNDVWETRVFDWATNPNTGVAWTIADINGSGSNPLQTIGFWGYLNSAGGAGLAYGSQVYVTVYYETTDDQALLLITEPVTGLFTASRAMALLLVENYDASVVVSVSTDTTPSWTSLGALTYLCTAAPGVDLYCTALTAITGSDDRENAIKIEADYGNDTLLHGAYLYLAA